MKISDIIKESPYLQAAIRRFLMKLIEEGTIVVEKNNSNKVYRINKEG